MTVLGEEVVVKVQRPGIAEQIRADLSVLHYIARALEAVVEEVGVYTPTGIIEEFDRAIHEELDFLNEASNIRAFYDNHVGRIGIRIPKVYEQLSTRGVLTMEYLHGPKLSQAIATMSEEGKQRLAKNMLENGFKQLFEDGLFHGDPHPGNLLILDGEPPDNPVLALIDFGLVGRITRQMADTLVSLIVAVALKDSDSVARLLYRMGSADARPNLLGFKNDIEAIIGQYLPTELSKINARTLMRELLNLAMKHKIRIPKEYAILSRASIATEGILRSLFPSMNIGEVALPYAKHLLTDRFDPTQLQSGLLKTLNRLQSAASDLPMQLSQILLDLEAGKFSVTIKSDQLGELNKNLRALAVISFFGLCACGLIVGAFISFASKDWAIGGVPLLGMFAVVASSFLFGVMMTWYLFGKSVKKVSLTRLFGKGR